MPGTRNEAVSQEKGRSGLVLFLGLGLALLLALAALGVSFLGGSEQEIQSSSLPPMGSAASDKSLGVNADLGFYDGDASAQALSDMEAAGLRWLRLRFPWDEIEAKEGVYQWTVWDDIIGEASKHNLQILAVLDGSPAWAREDADLDNALAPPAEMSAFGDFVSIFAQRYGHQIDHYQIWDEPNIAPHWGAREIDPAAYARMLREGAIQIRSADPGGVVLAAALAPTVEPGGANMSELLYLEELYQHGAAEWFDGVAVQLYDFGQTLDEPADPARLNWQRVSLLRAVMERQGDSETPVWAVSAGLDDTDASEVSAAIEAIRDHWPWLGPIVWAAWTPRDARGVHALMDERGQPHPAFDSLRSLATAPPVAWPGAYLANHESGRYEGNWRVTPSGADIGDSGDRLHIPFRGTRLDLVVRRGEYRAFLFVTVDGQPANALPQDLDGRAYVVLYDPLSDIDSITLARDLGAGAHVAEIVAERGWGQWAIGGWRVWNGADLGLPWRTFSMLLGLAALATFVVALWQAWPQRRVVARNVAQLSERCVTVDERLVLAFTAGAAILVYLAPGTIPSLLTLGLLFTLLLLRPATGLPLIAVVLPFYQVGKPLLGKVFSMVEILTVLTAVAWLASWAVGAVLGRNARVPGRSTDGGVLAGLRSVAGVPKPSALDWGMLALVLVGLASLLWAEHGRVAAREFRTVVLGSALFYWLLRAMVRGRQTAWRVTDAWVLGGTLVALASLVQWVLGENLITADGVSRVRAFYGSPNNLALYLGRLLPLVLVFTVWSRRQPRKWFYGIAAIAMAAALLLTFSRGAWLVGVPFSMLFVAGLRGRRSLILAAGLLAVAALMVLLLMGPTRLALLLDPATDTTYFRLQLWRSSLAMIRDHPVLGVGLDNFLYQYRTHYVLPTAWEEFNLSHPHNLVLDSWLRLGLPGLAVFLWLMVSFFRSGWLAYRHLRESGERLLALGLLGGMVYTVAHGLIDNAFFLVDLAYVLALMLALVQWTRLIVEKAPNGIAAADSASPVN
jgi:O-antigen ligase